MSIRRLEWIGLIAALAIGAALTPGAIPGESRTMLITFLGLLSASILPTITLLINSMTSSGRSVQAVKRLNAELEAAMAALLFIFGCIIVAVGALVSLSLSGPAFFSYVPYLQSDILPRGGQAIVTGAAFMILNRASQIPAILRRSLAVRHEIAVAEARRKLTDGLPDPVETKRMFASHPAFGNVVKLQDPEA